MRAQIHFVRLDDPEASVQSAALAALLRDGWVVCAHFVGEREGVPCLALVLAPPVERRRVDTLAAVALAVAALVLAASVVLLTGAA